MSAILIYAGVACAAFFVGALVGSYTGRAEMLQTLGLSWDDFTPIFNAWYERRKAYRKRLPWFLRMFP